MHEVERSPRGRHDPCVLPRAVDMGEGMVARVSADHVLRRRAIEFTEETEISSVT